MDGEKALMMSISVRKEYPCGCRFEYEEGVATTTACSARHEALIEMLMP